MALQPITLTNEVFVHRLLASALSPAPRSYWIAQAGKPRPASVKPEPRMVPMAAGAGR
jgi:hypothetical protein